MSFDPLARHYRWLEYLAFGRDLERCRLAFLQRALTAERALILGEGDGRFVRELLRVNATVQVDCVDASGQMLSRAQGRLLAEPELKSERVRFIHADACAWPYPKEAYDLIVTHFFLDCFTSATLEKIIPRIASAAQPEATWLIGDFQMPPNGWRRCRAQLWLKCLYGFFRQITNLEGKEIFDHAPLFQRLGFACSEVVEFQHGLLGSAVWERKDDREQRLGSCYPEGAI